MPMRASCKSENMFVLSIPLLSVVVALHVFVVHSQRRHCCSSSRDTSLYDYNQERLSLEEGNGRIYVAVYATVAECRRSIFIAAMRSHASRVFGAQPNQRDPDKTHLKLKKLSNRRFKN
jgi:hypothetical protein